MKKIRKWINFLLALICFLMILNSIFENYTTFKLVLIIITGIGVVIVFIATIMEMRENKKNGNC